MLITSSSRKRGGEKKRGMRGRVYETNTRKEDKVQFALSDISKSVFGALDTFNVFFLE
jgi:hypothetical protein